MIKVGSGYLDPDIRPSISRSYLRNSVTQPSLHHFMLLYFVQLRIAKVNRETQ